MKCVCVCVRTRGEGVTVLCVPVSLNPSGRESEQTHSVALCERGGLCVSSHERTSGAREILWKKDGTPEKVGWRETGATARWQEKETDHSSPCFGFYSCYICED